MLHLMLIMVSEAMMRAAGGDCRRAIPVHEERLKDLFPSRAAGMGLRTITELALAGGGRSRALDTSGQPTRLPSVNASIPYVPCSNPISITVGSRNEKAGAR